MQVCQVFLVNSGSFGKVDYFLSFSSPSTLAHFPNFTKHPSFSSQLSLPSRQHGMIGRHFFLSKLKKKPQNTVNMKNSLQNHSLFYEIYKFPVFSLGPLFRNFITAIPRSYCCCCWSPNVIQLRSAWPAWKLRWLKVGWSNVLCKELPWLSERNPRAILQFIPNTLTAFKITWPKMIYIRLFCIPKVVYQ